MVDAELFDQQADGDDTLTESESALATHDFDVTVVGAGFSGLYALHRLRTLGLSVRVLERGSGVGGTWFWNHYPGARCDIESVDYCYSFSEDLLDEWQWTERYAAQPEILRYLNHVADRFDLRRDIQLETEVERISFDEATNRTYNRDNVDLIDLRREPIDRITERGIRTEAAEYEVDCIVFAIGFDAMTGALLDLGIRGTGGRTLREHWADGPRTYLGLAVSGFPNLFVVTGPGSPSVLSNMVVSIEQHVDWISDCITGMRRRGVDRIEATAEAEQGWVDHANELADATLYPVANSWYVGANIPGKPRVFMPYVAGCGIYREECDQVVRRGYHGFRLSPGTELSAPKAEVLA